MNSPPLSSCPPDIDTVGTGSLATLVACALKARGHAVRLWSERRPAGSLRVEIEGPGTLLSSTFPVLRLPEEPRDGSFSPLLILASKAPACRAFLERLLRWPDPLPEVWVACNGLGLLDDLPLERFSNGLSRLVCGFGVRETAPERYQFSGGGSAEWAPRVPGRFSAELEQSLTAMNISVSRHSDVRQVEWRKIAWNASMNGILALQGLRNGALAESPALLKRFDALLAETITIARLEGVELDPEGQLRQQLLASIEKTANNLNSMAVDLLKGRPTEVAWINGAVVRAAARHGVSAPENQRLLEEIQARSAD